MTRLFYIVTGASLAFSPAIMHDANPKFTKIEDSNVNFMTKGLKVLLVRVFELIELFEALVKGL